MSILKWKKVNLLTLHPSVIMNSLSKNNKEIVAYCNNITHKVFCEASGRIHVFLPNNEKIALETFGSSIKLCTITEENNVLVTVCEDIVNYTHVNIFDLNKIRSSKNMNFQLQIVKSANELHACFDGKKLLIALAFDSGEVLLHQIIYTKNISDSERLTTQKYIKVCSSPIRGIKLKPFDNKYDLFVCADEGIFCCKFIIDTSNIEVSKIILDKNTNRHQTFCCSMDNDKSSEFIFSVAREDAVYCFSNDSLAARYEIEGTKFFLGWYANNMVIVTTYIKSPSHNNQFSLLVIDIKNEMIVLNIVLNSFLGVMIQNQLCHVITKEKVFILRDIDCKSKIMLLTRRLAFEFALRISENDNIENNAGLIYLKNGDYLISKGDINGAVEKYILTIGWIEPYNVIQKLMEPKYNNLLVQYLHRLCQTKFCTNKHEKLLQTCLQRLNLAFNVENICSERRHGNFDESIYVGNIDSATKKNEISDDFKVNAGKVAKHISEYNENEIFDILKDCEPVFHGDILQKLFKSRDNIILRLERFIPFIISYQSMCRNFLELAIQYTKLDYSSAVTLLCELNLEKWQNSETTSDSVIEYIRKSISFSNIDNIFMLCRLYNFWPGILYMQNENKNFRINMRTFFKSNEFDVLLKQDKSIDLTANFWNNELCRNQEVLFNKSRSMVNCILSNMINDVHQPLYIKLLRDISSNRDLRVNNIKDIFSKDFSNQYQYDQIEYMFRSVNSLRQSFKQISNNPLELNSILCDKCSQRLHFPAVYYLCQHSFHYECVASYSNNEKCITCQDTQLEPIVNINEVCDDSVAKVSMLISQGILNNNNVKLTYSSSSKHSHSLTSDIWLGRLYNKSGHKTTISNQKNPFEEETDKNQGNLYFKYDDNLNPFTLN